jgi:hypothetical protein
MFRDPRGGLHAEEPEDRPALDGDPVGEVLRANRARSADPGPLDASVRWTRERDIPDEVYFDALEAGFAAVDGARAERGAADAGPAPP